MQDFNYQKELELKNKMLERSLENAVTKYYELYGQHQLKLKKLQEVDKQLLSMFFKLEMLLKADQNQNKDYINV